MQRGIRSKRGAGAVTAIGVGAEIEFGEGAGVAKLPPDRLDLKATLAPPSAQ